MQESAIDSASSEEIVWNAPTTSTEPLHPMEIMDDIQDVPFLKRMKTRFLTYLRQNYLKVFYILLLIIGILIVLLIIDSLSRSTEYQPQVTTPQVAINRFAEIANVTDQDDFKSVVTLRCGKITCHENKTLDCNLTDIAYDMLKRYSCCRCMTGFRLIRVEYYPLESRYDMILRPNWTVVPDQISLYDTASWPSLPYLQGVWGVVSESPGTGYLKYSNIRVKRSP